MTFKLQLRMASFATFSLLTFVSSLPLSAQVVSNWTGNGANDAFFNNSNWSAGIPPTDGVGIFELGGAYEVDINADADLLQMSVNQGDFLFTGGNTLHLNDSDVGAVVGGGFTPSSLRVRGPGTRIVSDGDFYIFEQGTLALDRVVFESDAELLSTGTMVFDGLFANMDVDVRVVGGNIDVPISNSGPTNFLRELQNGSDSEIFIASGKRINVFGNYTGAGVINGPGVIHFQGQVDPGANENQFLFGVIPIEGDVVFETTANFTVRINGNNILGSDRMQVGGDLDLLLPSLSLAVTEGCELFPGDQVTIVEIDGNRSGSFIAHSEGDVVRTFGDIDMQISYVGGDGNDITLTAIDNGALLGDVNQDGQINLLDVAPFVTRISFGQFQAEADVNEDGLVDLLDVNRFVEILTGGGN